jgi:hypothetical protein
MLFIVILIWLFISWIVLCTNIIDSNDYAKTFKIKSLFFWISIILLIIFKTT